MSPALANLLPCSSQFRWRYGILPATVTSACPFAKPRLPPWLHTAAQARACAPAARLPSHMCPRVFFGDFPARSQEMGVSIGVRRKLLDALRACASSQPPTQPTGAATSPAAGMAACVAPTLRPKPGICSGGASAAPSAASAFSFIGGGASSGLLSAAHTAEGATAGGTGADGLFAGMGILDSGIGKLAGSTPAHSSFGHATGAQPAAAGPLSGGGCSCGPTTGPASCLHSMGSPVCAYGSCGASPGLLGFQGCMPPSSAPMSAGVSRSVALDADAFCCASQAPAQPSAANTDAASRTGSAFSFLS